MNQSAGNDGRKNSVRKSKLSYDKAGNGSGGKTTDCPAVVLIF
ncbi:hypothetical protein D1BOALGB6SA_1424 [Olavius sp. associated proteobacterium Delta 1]|nr:hypothetical protein D1BOALGB6SA_1424 [Olavius sp. associated proteobacterium Delta 1]